MTTSGSTNFTMTAEEMLRDALYKIEALEEGEQITGEHTVSGLRAMNRILKRWNTHQLRWARREGTVFLNPNQQQYSLPGDNCASGRWGYTKLNGALTASATAVTVDSTAPGQPHPDMAGTNIIGIELSDGSRHWDVVSSVDSSTTLTLTTGVSGAASDDASVIWYATEIERPVRVFNMRRGTYSGAEVPIDPVSRDFYMNQPNKASSSTPTMVHYAPEVGTGVLYIWPTSSTVNNVLRFTYQRALEDVDAITNTLDMPEEFAELMIYELADRLAPEYQTPLDKRSGIKSDLAELRDELLSFDEDDTFMQMVPCGNTSSGG